MTFRVITRFEGKLDRNAFVDALHRVAERHPLLYSTLDGELEALTWKRFQGRLNEIQGEQQPLTSFDLRSAPGLAAGIVTVNSAETDSDATRASKGREHSVDYREAIFDFHHACVDGQGAGRFISDVFREMSDPGSTARRRFDQSLHDRGIFPEPSPENRVGSWEGMRNFWHTIRGRTLRFRQDIAPPDDTTDSTPDRICIASLSKSQSRWIRKTLIDPGWNGNDNGLVATFQALAGLGEVWQIPGAGRNGWLTVMNPVDLRDWSDRRRAACNRIGLAYLRRQVAQVGRAEFADSIHQEMEYVRQKNVGVEFLKGLEAVEKAPRLLQFIRRRRWFDPTASLTCLTNLRPGSRFGMKRDGEYWKLGEGRFRSMTAIPTRPAGCALAIALMESEGKSRITLRADSSSLSDDQMKAFAASWFSFYLNAASSQEHASSPVAEVEFESLT